MLNSFQMCASGWFNTSACSKSMIAKLVLNFEPNNGEKCGLSILRNRQAD